jgi:hypothetical protein
VRLTLWLAGISCCGESTAGRGLAVRLAARLGFLKVHLDAPVHVCAGPNAPDLQLGTQDAAPAQPVDRVHALPDGVFVAPGV